MREITGDQLKGILDAHKDWINSDGKEGAMADLSGVDLSNIDLSGVDLSGAKLSSAFLLEANLKSANLSDAILDFADLSCANLKGANLSSANFSYANLVSVDLSGSDLSYSCLFRSRFCSANISNANLRNSYLEATDFESAILSGADISGAYILNLKTQGWNVKGIKCTHVYICSLRVSKADQEKSLIKFEEGEFEDKYKAMPTIEIVLSGRLQVLDILKMIKIIEKMNRKYNTGLELNEMKSVLNGVVYVLKSASEENLEEIGSSFLKEYRNCNIDGKLLTIFRKEKLLNSLTEASINNTEMDISKVFSQISDANVKLVNIGTINIIGGDVNADAVAIGHDATLKTIINNYYSNTEEIDNTLQDFKKELSEDLQRQIDVLKEALKKKDEKEASAAWRRIKDTVEKTSNVVNTGEKAFKLYQKLEGWFEAGLNLIT